jgi:hypothetical protein
MEKWGWNREKGYWYASMLNVSHRLWCRLDLIRILIRDRGWLEIRSWLIMELDVGQVWILDDIIIRNVSYEWCHDDVGHDVRECDMTVTCDCGWWLDEQVCVLSMKMGEIMRGYPGNVLGYGKIVTRSYSQQH